MDQLYIWVKRKINTKPSTLNQKLVKVIFLLRGSLNNLPHNIIDKRPSGTMVTVHGGRSAAPINIPILYNKTVQINSQVIISMFIFQCYMFREWQAPPTFRQIDKLPPIAMRNVCPYMCHVFMCFIRCQQVLVMNITEIMFTSPSSAICPSTGMLLYIY